MRLLRGTRYSPISALLLIVGFLGLGAAVVIAHFSPATGYEASIYTATPRGVWIGLTVALTCSLLVASFAASDLPRRFAVVLAVGSGLSVASLPIVRGYYFYGYGDALTHLGWARDVATGDLSPFELFYPGLHTGTVVTSRLLGLPIPLAMMLVVLSMLTIFLVFVPLCVRELTGRPIGLVVGAFAAVLVLPVNHVAFHYMNPHPISEAIMLSPLVLYLLLRFLDGSVGPSVELPVVGTIGAVDVLFALSLVGTLFTHSMQAANLLAVFGSIVLVQFVAARYADPDSYPVGRRRLYGHTLGLAAIFALWNVRFPVVTGTIETTIRSVRLFAGGEAEAGAVVSSRSSSLGGVGAGLGEIFLKLFVPSLLFCVLTALVVGLSWRRWNDESLSGVRVLGVGLVGLFCITLPFVAGNVSKLVFRNLGFGMVFATILGSVALCRYLTRPDRIRTVTGRRVVLGGVLAIMLAVSVVVLFPSPYIYQPNGGVAETEYQGYRQAFDHRDEGVAFAGVRSGPQRVIQSVYGRNGVPDDLATFGYYRQYGSFSGENLTRLPAVATSSRYLLVTDHDRIRELVAYRGYRYSRAQLDAVDEQAGVDRVLSNGPFKLYLVEPEG